MNKTFEDYFKKKIEEIDKDEETGYFKIKGVNPCPNCGCVAPLPVVNGENLHAMLCPFCDTSTSIEPSEEAALEAWNNKKPRNDSNMVVAFELYEYLKDRCADLDNVSIVTILSLVGSYGLVVLKDAGLIELAGAIDDVQMYALCRKRVD